MIHEAPRKTYASSGSPAVLVTTAGTLRVIISSFFEENSLFASLKARVKRKGEIRLYAT